MNGWLHDGLRPPDAATDACRGARNAWRSARARSPREAGTKMLVHGRRRSPAPSAAAISSSGPSASRATCSRASRLDLRRFPLGASLGQCCGGAVTLLFEPVAGRPEWIDTLLDCEDAAAPWVVATAERGGAKMVITATHATGNGPDAVVAMARRLLCEEEARMSECDGMRWLLDPSPQPSLHVVLFGAGHVGRAHRARARHLPCRVTWVDARDGEFPQEVPANIRIDGDRRAARGSRRRARGGLLPRDDAQPRARLRPRRGNPRARRLRATSA